MTPHFHAAISIHRFQETTGFTSLLQPTRAQAPRWEEIPGDKNGRGSLKLKNTTVVAVPDDDGWILLILLVAQIGRVTDSMLSMWGLLVSRRPPPRELSIV